MDIITNILICCFEFLWLYSFSRNHRVWAQYIYFMNPLQEMLWNLRVLEPKLCISFESVYLSDLWNNKVSSCGRFYKQIHILNSVKRKIPLYFSLINTKLLCSCWSLGVVFSGKPYLENLQLVTLTVKKRKIEVVLCSCSWENVA